MSSWKKRLIAYAVVSPVILMLTFLAFPVRTPHSDSRLNYVKIHMHSLEMALEAYAEENNGFYPADFETLRAYDPEQQYWKPILNPYTGQDASNQVISLNSAHGKLFGYLYNQIHGKKKIVKRPDLKGYLVYAPESESVITAYSIYGIAKDGGFIQSRGRLFYLYNGY